MDAARMDAPGAGTPPDGAGGAEDATGGTWTAGIVEDVRSQPAVTLRAVRSARHADFDRVVFEFEGGRLPGYHIAYIDAPVRACGSGHTVSMAGDGWLEVRLTPARAHTEAGAPTITERTRAPGLPVVRELAMTCDFEAIVTWVLGAAAPNRYRVTELADPARLVVDVRH